MNRFWEKPLFDPLTYGHTDKGNFMRSFLEKKSPKISPLETNTFDRFPLVM